MMNKNSIWVGLGVLLLLVLAVAALAQGNNGSDNAAIISTPTPATTRNVNQDGGIITTPRDESDLSSDNLVIMIDQSFSPATLSVRKGTTVTWRNEDSVAHTVKADQATPLSGLNSGEILPGTTYTYTFNETGTWDYLCTTHPNMRGRVVVLP